MKLFASVLALAAALACFNCSTRAAAEDQPEPEQDDPGGGLDPVPDSDPLSLA